MVPKKRLLKSAFAIGVALLALLPEMASAQPELNLEAELKALSGAVLSSLPKGSLVLATCGPSEGRGYYLSPKHDGWIDDPISSGRTIFISSPDGKANILFQDSRGVFINAHEDGAIVTFSFLDPAKLSFGMIETYPSTGVTQTYTFAVGDKGERLMLWTAVKAHVSIANITKVSAYVSKCVL